MKQVLEGVTLPTAGEAGQILRNWAQYLTTHFRDIGFRLNRALPRDGSERMTNPLPLAVYTVATTPDPALWPGTLIFVSDAPGGHQLQGSNGTAWVALS